LIHLFETNHTLRFWNAPSDEFLTDSVRAFFFNRLLLLHHERELPHDDFRRAHHDFRDPHYYWRRPNYDFVMMFIPRVPVPSAFRENTSGGGEEGDNAGQ
jgi:hypothetical protein